MGVIVIYILFLNSVERRKDKFLSKVIKRIGILSLVNLHFKLTPH